MGPLFLNHPPIQARAKDRPGHQVEVPVVILRGNCFPSWHGTATFFALFVPIFSGVVAAALRRSPFTPPSPAYSGQQSLCLSPKSGHGGIVTAGFTISVRSL